jgi:hypothetical protein
MRAAMAQKPPSFDELGIKFGTGKSSSGHSHDYRSFYDAFCERIRQDRINLLEIGVLSGVLRMWAEYFPNGVVLAATYIRQ